MNEDRALTIPENFAPLFDLIYIELVQRYRKVVVLKALVFRDCALLSPI
jgi:hypothetical protein